MPNPEREPGNDPGADPALREVPPPAPRQPDEFWRMVAEAVRDGASHTAFVDVLRSYGLTQRELEDILAELAQGRQ